MEGPRSERSKFKVQVATVSMRGRGGAKGHRRFVDEFSLLAKRRLQSAIFNITECDKAML